MSVVGQPVQVSDRRPLEDELEQMVQVWLPVEGDLEVEIFPARG